MLTLRGITTDEKDLSVDLIRTVTLPHLAMFGVEDGLELKVRITPRLCRRNMPHQPDRSRREAHLQEAVERYNSYHLS
jgi:RNA 3'-terminal phosphate cyclase